MCAIDIVFSFPRFALHVLFVCVCVCVFEEEKIILILILIIVEVEFTLMYHLF